MGGIKKMSLGALTGKLLAESSCQRLEVPVLMAVAACASPGAPVKLSLLTG